MQEVRVKAKNRFGTVLVLVGFLCLSAAAGFVIYNVQDDIRAGNEIRSVNVKLEQIIAERAAETVNTGSETEPAEDIGTEELPQSDTTAPPAGGEPLFSGDMPTVNIDGVDYVAFLQIPSLGLDFAVQNDCDLSALKLSPCRYIGSAYSDSLIVCAHNYQSFFRPLFDIEQGTEVILSDVNGNRFVYTVDLVETVDRYDIRTMTSSGYDLTLFTCTIGGKSRVTVRCSLVYISLAGKV